MRTVQMTLDEDLLAAVDQATKKLNTSRSAFTRQALRKALQSLEEEDLDRQHRRGYELHPIDLGEFDGWEAEQAWGDE